MRPPHKTIEQSRLEIVLLATGVLALVLLLGVLVFINLGPRRKAHCTRVEGYQVPAWKSTPESSDNNDSTEVQQHKSFIDNVRRRSPPTPVHGTKEMLTLRRRIMLWSSGEPRGGDLKQGKVVTKLDTEEHEQASSEPHDTVEQDSQPEHRDSLELPRSIIARAPTNEVVTRARLFGWR